MAKAAPATEKPNVPEKRMHLTPDEANRLIRATTKRGRHGFRDMVLVRMVYRHGMRASEAVGLRWDHLDLEAGTLHVKRAKMGKASMHTMDRDELKDLRKLASARGSSLYVFETERGGPLSVDALQRIVREAGEIAKLPVPAHPHMLRHAAGYALINEGHDVRLVQDFLGHRSIQSTAHYTALSPHRLAALRVR